MDDAGASLEIRNVSRGFGGVLALKDLTLHLPDDRLTAIIGPNGAGKTTLFNVITGYVAPDKGTITYRKRRLNGKGPHQLAKLGIVRTFQELRLFEPLSVLDNLRTAARDDPWPIIEQLGLQEYARHRTGDLSYAVQKLVALGRALAMRPRILLLDEPTSGLDRTSVRLMLDILGELRQQQLGICLIEHNLDIVRQLDPLVFCLHMGSLFAQGDLRTLSQSADVQRIFFGEEASDEIRPAAH